MSTPNTKEEQLARVRRNQQRSRARKRAQVANLETQVQDLQVRLEQCTPCPPTPASPSISELERYRRENATRRDLLCALGFSEETQQRYIDSTAQRHAVQVALSAASFDAGQKVHNLAQQGATLPQPPGPKCAGVVTAPSESADNRFSLNTNKLPTDDTNMNADFDINEWMLSLNATGGPPFLVDNEADDPSWLSNSTLQVSTESTTVDQAGPAPFASSALESNVQLAAEALSAKPLSTPSAQPCPSAASESSLDRCFLETAINFRPGKSSTACSVAIAMVLQHNRRGLSLAELQERMRPGFVAAKDGSTECKVRDVILSEVLTDISKAEEDDNS